MVHDRSAEPACLLAPPHLTHSLPAAGPEKIRAGFVSECPETLL